MMTRLIRLSLIAAAAALFSLPWRPANGGDAAHESGRPERIVSMSPAATEILFAVGAGERVVGVTEFCVYPPEAAERVKCGGYFNPNFELLLVLQPDLIAIQGRHEALREFCERHSIATVNVELEGIDGILQDIEALGVAADSKTSATILVQNIKADLAALKAVCPAPEDRPSVFLSLHRSPGELGTIFSAGGGSFLDEMVALAGGRNVLHDVETLYPQISVESLIVREPDVILELLPGSLMNTTERAKFLEDWSVLEALPAVGEGRLRVLTDGALLIPGPRLVRSIAALRLALHPDAALPQFQTYSPPRPRS